LFGEYNIGLLFRLIVKLIMINLVRVKDQAARTMLPEKDARKKIRISKS
jgi:hypothetical protein